MQNKIAMNGKIIVKAELLKEIFLKNGFSNSLEDLNSINIDIAAAKVGIIIMIINAPLNF
jgi:alkylhydroperoxidase/carboxymuconolactone decarboxylase family protein YurZ